MPPVTAGFVLAQNLRGLPPLRVPSHRASDEGPSTSALGRIYRNVSMTGEPPTYLSNPLLRVAWGAS